MKIKTLGNRIQLKIDEVEAGGLDTSSMMTAVEFGTVLDIGEDVTLKIKKGDKVFFKSWAVDIITHQSKRYFFISEDTKGLCAIVS